MKRLILSIAALVFVSSALLALVADDAGAHRHGRHHGYHHYHHAGAWVVPPPAGKSSWCRKNPNKCHGRSRGDPKVNTKYENCMDAKGNGDGYISGWERDWFGNVCK